MKEAQIPIPHLFRCPISLDLFTDPVTLCTGHTYDRCSIEKWLAAGNLTCPVTMQKLHDPVLVPNHTLRHLIQHWLRISKTSPHFDTGNPKVDLDFPLAALKQNLESHEFSLESKLLTLEKIRVIAEEFPSRSSCLAQLGFFRVLLDLLFGEVGENGECQSNMKLAEAALSCVVKLMPCGEMGCLNMLKEEARIQSFLALFEKGTTTVKISLCRIIEAVSSSLETEELCAILASTQKLLQGIILLLQQNSEASEAGIKTILAMCSSESSRKNLVREGAVDGLITYISNSQGCEKNSSPLAVGAIEMLLHLRAAKQAVLNSPNGLKVLVKMVFRVSDHKGSESAINSLMIMCYESEKAREEAVYAGILTQLLLLLQSQCCGRTKAKARALLKLLRSLWAKEEKHV